MAAAAEHEDDDAIEVVTPPLASAGATWDNVEQASPSSDRKSRGAEWHSIATPDKAAKTARPSAGGKEASIAAELEGLNVDGDTGGSCLGSDPLHRWLSSDQARVPDLPELAEKPSPPPEFKPPLRVFVAPAAAALSRRSSARSGTDAIAPALAAHAHGDRDRGGGDDFLSAAPPTNTVVGAAGQQPRSSLRSTGSSGSSGGVKLHGRTGGGSVIQVHGRDSAASDAFLGIPPCPSSAASSASSGAAKLRSAGRVAQAAAAVAAPERQRASLLERRAAKGAAAPRLRLNTALAKEEAASSLQGFGEATDSLEKRYDVIEVISQGSAAVVHRALRRSDHRQVALKVIRSVDEEMVRLTQHEHELIASLDHRHIVRTLDFFTDTSRIVLVLDFFDGLELASAVPRASGGRLSEGASLGLFRALAEAIAYLHRRRVIHRDIKPQNILVARDLSDLKLVDFNTAARLDQDGALTMTGTMLYLAPEVLLGDSPARESDIWACGLCLHFMLSGLLPQGRDKFAKASLADLRPRATLEPSLSEPVWSTVSEPCKAALGEVLATDPLSRPNADAMLKCDWLRSGGLVGHPSGFAL